MSKKCTNATCTKKPLKKKRPAIIWVMGGPGAGKNTQSKIINAEYGFTHLCAADQLRNEVAIMGTPRGKELETIMQRGDLIPTEIILELFKEKMEKDQMTAQAFIFDGFPTDREQGILFERKICPVDLVLFLEVCDDTMMERVKCAGKISKTETVKQMIDAFKKFRDQIIEQYSDRVKKINGEQSIEEVSAEIRPFIDSMVERKNQ